MTTPYGPLDYAQARAGAPGASVVAAVAVGGGLRVDVALDLTLHVFAGAGA